ncbi:PQQ-binding-like beta-propeller repeat protein [Streptomyces sp. MUM 16J]|uniref:outer membrane protein assembly factor BamB family protein n=1 Tax=Streptomyces sp. MUM 16J TaxID=2791988 RepID=UPI001F03AAEE|nr:PQQ-binding-like beta-propeller repeat protein [Streptomyces sp. MUM 16J]MCH0556912.1 PQQ-binding-like beta-propeller repeat protein [Streptomyces sp. MUM 16J]
MTKRPSPEEDTSRQDAGWAFRPRTPVGAQPGRESRPETPAATTVPIEQVAPASWSTLDSGTTPAPLGAPAPVPTAGTAPPPGPDTAQLRPKRWWNKRGMRIVLALAVLATAGGAALVLVQEDAVPVASRQLTQAWTVPAPASDDELVGSWRTDTLLIRASTRGGVSAYRLSDGRRMWQTTPPAKGSVPCAMSPAPASQGIGTVGFGQDGNSCTSLAGIDTATGKIKWSVPLIGTKHPTAVAAQTYVQGNVATVVSENFLGGLDVRTGRRVWGFKARGSYCNAYDWGGEGTVLVDDYCVDQKKKFTFTAYDGTTGKVLWSEAQRTHTEVTHVLSGSPLIAAVHTPVEDSVRVFASSGHSHKLAVGNTEVAPGNDSAADHSARLVGNVLVTPAQSSTGSEVDGYDVTTGAKLWSCPSAALATDADGTDRVYVVTTSGTPQLLRLDPHTGHATPIARLPVGSGHSGFTTGTVYVTRDGGVLELDAQGKAGGVRYYR